jgi:DNA ligase-1
MFVSEKYDGIRCFWDGGVTRGKLKKFVPWANCAKDDRLIVEEVSTGLWSRYGNVIHAPDAWLDQLPKIPLDGELWCGRGEGSRQKLTSTVKKIYPDELAWRDVTYMVFDIVPLTEVFREGKIDNLHFKKKFYAILEWIALQDYAFDFLGSPNLIFRSSQKVLHGLDPSLAWRVADQTKIRTLDDIESIFSELTSLGAEGIVIRKPDVVWEPCRSHNIFKMKMERDMEGTVVGFISGKETDKGSKHLGRIGSIIVDIGDEKEVRVSGLTDKERAFAEDWMEDEAAGNPGARMPGDFEGYWFSVGDIITFKYREMSRDGIPVEARYLRHRDKVID